MAAKSLVVALALMVMGGLAQSPPQPSPQLLTERMVARAMNDTSEPERRTGDR